MMMRRVATLDGRGIVAVQEEPIPAPAPGQVLIEVKASLISPGTELGSVPGRRAHPNPEAKPYPFGYSNAGLVIQRGEGCEDIPEGTPLACMGGGYALHASHAVVPRNLTTPIPEGVSFAEASFCHLAATALQAIRRGEIVLCENVAVVGLGLVGQLSCQLAHLAGAHVLGLDRWPLRLNRARDNGADLVVNVAEEDPVPVAAKFTRGYGLDCAIIAFGGEATAAFKQVVQMMKTAPDTHKMGRIVIVGGARIDHTFAAALGNLDVRSAARTGPGYHDEAYEHGRDYPPVFVQWTTRRHLEEILRLIEEKKLNVQSLITHTYPLDEAAEACEQLIQHPDQALGVVLEP